MVVVAVLSTCLLVVVALWRHYLAVVVRFWASIFYQHDWQSHLRFALLLTDVLEGTIASLAHQIVGLLIISSVIGRARCQTSLRNIQIPVHELSGIRLQYW